MVDEVVVLSRTFITWKYVMVVWYLLLLVFRLKVKCNHFKISGYSS